MYLSFLLAAVLAPLSFPADTIPEARVVADRGIIVSKTDTLTVSGAISITEVLNISTGLYVNDNGGSAGLKTVGLRGLGSPHTDIYMDGVRVGNVQSGQCDLGLIDVLNCNNAIIDYTQNSISFNTARPCFAHRPVAGRFSFSGGSQTTFIPSARLDFKLSERLALRLSGSGNFSRGDFLCGDGQRRENNDISQVRAGIDLFSLADGGDWHAKAYYNGAERGAPGSVSWPSDDRQRDRNAFAQCVLRKQFQTLYSLNLSGKLAYDELSYTSKWGDSRYGQTEIQINSAHKFQINRWLNLSLAADIWWDNLVSTGYDASRISTQVAMGTAFRTGRFGAVLALRYDGCFDLGAKPRNTISPSLGLSFQVLECLKVTASGRRACRVPTFNELYYVGYGNPDLKPEDAILTDLGVEFSRHIDGRWAVDAKADGFANWLRDKITSAPSPEDPNYWQPYNIGRVLSTGLDLAAGIGYKGPWWTYGLKMSYTWQRAVDKTESSDSYDRQLAYIPEHSLSLNADVDFRGWGAAAAWTLRAGRYDNAGRIPDWNTLDLTIFKELQLQGCGPLILKLIGKNITNRQYELSSGYPMPGISVYGGIDFRF